MIDLKPYALFIQNTIKPIIDDVNDILKELERQGAKLDDGTIRHLIKSATWLHCWSVACNALAQLAGWIAVGVIGWMIFR